MRRLRVDENFEDLKWEAKKDSEGNYKPLTLKLSFSNSAINTRLCKYLAARKLLDKVIADTESYSSKEEHENAIKESLDVIDEIKNHLMDSNQLVRKNIVGLEIKNSPTGKI